MPENNTVPVLSDNERKIIDEKAGKIMSRMIESFVQYQTTHPYRCRTVNETANYKDGYFDGYNDAQDIFIKLLGDMKNAGKQRV